MQNPAFRAYLENKILTATPQQLQLMLYEGLIRFAQTARTGLEEEDFEKAQNAFERVSAILCELFSGLRPEPNQELYKNMGSLYAFCMGRMNEAAINCDISKIDDALLIMNQLKEMWIAALEQMAAERAEASTEASPGESLAVQV